MTSTVVRRAHVLVVMFALAVPLAAQGAACSPLNCAPSQFSVGDGSMLGYRSGAESPVTIVDLRAGKARFALPSGIVGGNLPGLQECNPLTWQDT